MVKSIERYTRESERERIAALRRLTYRQSAAHLEQLLRSRFIFELHFADDDHPLALSKHRHQPR